MEIALWTVVVIAILFLGLRLGVALVFRDLRRSADRFH
jgi:hypothetical protein